MQTDPELRLTDRYCTSTMHRGLCAAMRRTIDCIDMTDPLVACMAKRSSPSPDSGRMPTRGHATLDKPHVPACASRTVHSST